MLAMHPKVQERVYEEIKSLINDPSHLYFELDDIKKMTYTDQVLNEVFRLFPVGGIISRVTTGDVELGEVW